MNIDLEIQKLQAEIARLQSLKEAIIEPIQENLVDWSIVYEFAVNHLNEIVERDGICDDNIKQWLFESVMEAVYGKDVWKVYNQPS